VFDKIFQTVFFNNRIIDYLNTLGIFLVSILVISLFKRIILSRIKNWVKQTSTILDDLLIRIFEKSIMPLLYFGAFYISIRNLILKPSFTKAVDILGLLLLTFLT